VDWTGYPSACHNAIHPIVGFVTLMDAEVCIVFRSGYRVPGDRHPMETSRRLVGI